MQQTTMAHVYLCNKPAHSAHVPQNLKYNNNLKKLKKKTSSLQTGVALLYNIILNSFSGILCIYFILLYIYIFYCILGFGAHVKNVQDSCIGTHVAV